MNRTRVIGAVLVGGALIGSAYAVIAGLVDWRSGSPESHVPPPTPPAGPLRVVLGERPASRLDVGDVPRGGRREVPFVVANSGPRAVTVGAIRTSCECLRVELDAVRVEAGAEVGGRAVIDLTHEPGFAGGLVLDAEAAAEEGGRAVFVLKLSVAVR